MFALVKVARKVNMLLGKLSGEWEPEDVVVRIIVSRA